MRGLGDWLDSAGPADVPADYRTPAASILGAAPTETTLNGVIESIFLQTGAVDNLTLIAGSTLRGVISEFTRTEAATTSGTYRVTQGAETKKITLSVKIFDSDFGNLSMVHANPDCTPSATRGYIVNPAYLGVKSLIPMASTKLENQGGGDRGFVDSTLTFQCKHPGAFGKIAY